MPSSPRHYLVVAGLSDWSSVRLSRPLAPAFLPKPRRKQSLRSCRRWVTHIPAPNWINEHNLTQAMSSLAPFLFAPLASLSSPSHPPWRSYWNGLRHSASMDRTPDFFTFRVPWSTWGLWAKCRFWSSSSTRWGLRLSIRTSPLSGENDAACLGATLGVAALPKDSPALTRESQVLNE